VILYSAQCCYAVHWTDNNSLLTLIAEIKLMRYVFSFMYVYVWMQLIRLTVAAVIIASQVKSSQGATMTAATKTTVID